MSGIVKLYYFRHAESVANTKPQFIGGRSNETPLTDKGTEQAYQLGRALLARDLMPARVYASPATRTLQTADLALKAMGLSITPKVDPGLQEIDMGEWVGLNRDDVYGDQVMAEIKRLGKDQKPPAGESMNDVGQRMLATANGLVEPFETSDDTIIIFAFSHGLAIRCLASTIHNWSQTETFQALTDNASESLFIKDSQGWRLEYLGRDASLV